MFEKFIIRILKSGAAAIYVLIMITLFSAPVLFIWQAFTPPEFTFENIEIIENIENDTILSGEEKENWHRIDYKMTASSGKLSPYSYKIEEFTLESEALPEGMTDYRITINEPLEFSKTENDSFVLSLYIKTEADADIEEIIKNTAFKAANYEKSFSEFSVKYNETEEKPTEK